ncbi:hypothetical protein NEF87_001558 [Candidatus Lokiarchaeum ossiferum]|uniref:Acyltransferase 3 domain-containing protein n=1 Tax=Candidatus Lokiarchaeum ossiferum TaxID=2951803 RepID=A0ABY6HPL6_9ARCH|nr:hypothetical protein NEF87_001558 [Candidatus Lokiarchaeum sp. B-35]
MAKRLMSIDTFRGFAIFYVVLLHALVMRVFEQDRSHIVRLWDQTPTFLVIIFIPFIIIMIWGALFTFLSGISVAYSLTVQREQDETLMALKYKRQIIRGIMILLAQYLFFFLFSNQLSGTTSEITHSLITGSLETDIWALPSIFHFFTVGTLESIVISNWVICTIFYVLWKRKNKSIKQTYGWLIGIGIGIFVVAAILFQIVGDQQVVIENLGNQGRYAEQLLFIKFIGGRHSFFPQVAYGVFGAVIGVALANKESYKSIAKFGYGFGLIFLGIFLYTIFAGFDYVADLAGEHIPINVYCFNLGGQMIVTTTLIKMDYSSPKMTRIHARNSKMLRRYGKVSLSLYFLEGINSILWYKLFYWYNGGAFYTTGWMIAIFEFIVFIEWFFILKLWERKNFAFSIEDIIRRVETFLTETSRFAKKKKEIAIPQTTISQ